MTELAWFVEVCKSFAVPSIHECFVCSLDQISIEKKLFTLFFNEFIDRVVGHGHDCDPLLDSFLVCEKAMFQV